MIDKKNNELIHIDPDSTEDIGVPLTAGTSWDLPVSINLVEGGDVYNNKLYVAHRNGVIHRYALTGTTLEQTITVPQPPTPSALSGRSYVGVSAIAFYNNIFYVLSRWGGSRYSLETYSIPSMTGSTTSVTHNSNILTWAAGGVGNRASDITFIGTGSDTSVILVSGLDQNASVYQLSTGTRTNTFNVESTTIQGITATSNKIYCLARVGTGADTTVSIRVTDLSYNRITADDTNLVFDRLDGFLCNNENTIYLIDPHRTIYPFTIPQVIATAAWSSVSYTNNKLEGTITFSGASITGLETGDFEVLNASDAVQTGWTIELPTGITASSTITSGTGTVIKATPPTNTNGSFKIRLKATSVRSDGGSTDNSPAAAVVTDAISIDSRPQLSVSSFTASGTSQTGSTASLTLTFDRNIPATQLVTGDFSATGGASVTGISPTSGNASVYTITTTQPTNSSGSYTVTLAANSVAASTTYKGGPTSSYTSGSVTYDTRSAITISSFTAPDTSQTGTTSTLILTLNRSVPKTQLTTADFTTSISGATLSSVTGQGSLTTATVFNVVVNNPSTASGSYTVTLAGNAISAGTSYLAGPTSSYTSESLTYDTRTAIAVSSFTGPGTSQTGSTASLTLTLDRSVPATQLTTADFSATGGASVTGVSPTSGNVSVYTITVTQPTNGSGSYTVALSANAIGSSTTYLQGPTSAYTSSSITYDTRSAITVSSFTAPGTTQTGSTSTFRLTLAMEVPTGQITTTDFTAPSGTSISSVSAVGAGTNNDEYDVIVNNPTATSGSYTIQFNLNSISAGTSYLAGPTANYTSESLTYDTRVTISVNSFTAPSGTQRGTTAVLRLTLNRSVPASELTTSDFTATGGHQISSVATYPTSGQTNSAVYSVTVTQLINNSGSYTVSLKENAISGTSAYLQGPSTAYRSESVSFDTRTAISVSSFTAPDTTQTESTTALTLTFDRIIPATELSTSDFSATGGATVTGISSTSPSNTSYTITVTNPTNSNGTYTVSLSANTISAATTYLTGPTSAYASETVTYDTRARAGVNSFNAPASTALAPVTGSTSTFVLTLNRAVPKTEVTTADFSTSDSNAIVNSVTGRGAATTATIYDVIVTNPTSISGSYTVTLSANSISAGIGYLIGPLNSYASTTIYYDTRRAITVSSFTAPGTTQTGATSTFTLTVSTAIPKTQLTTADFSTSTSDASLSSVTGQGMATTATIFDVVVNNPLTASGSYTVTLAANTINAGTSYLAGPTSAYISGSVAYDTRPAVAVSSFTAPSGTQTGATASLRLTLDRSIPATELSASDFTGTNGASVRSISPTSGNTASYIVTANQPTRNSGTYTISLKADTISATSTYKTGPTNAYASEDVTYNTRVIATAAWSFVAYTSGKLTATLTFTDANVAGISASDFKVLNASNAQQTGWSFDTPSATASDGTGITISATPPANTNASFKFQLDATSVMSDGSSTNNAPAALVRSNTAAVDSRVFTIATAAWSSVSYTNNKLEGTLTFSGANVAGISATDFEILDLGNSAQTGWVFDSISATATAGTGIIVRATPPTNTNGSFKFRLNATSVRSGGSSVNNAPAAAATSTTAAIDNRPPVMVSSFNAPGTTQTGSTSTFVLTLNTAITKTELTASDFSVSIPSASINSVTGRGTSTTATVFDIIANNPTSGSGSYSVTLSPNSIPTTSSYKGGPVSSYTSTQVQYNIIVTIATAAWSNVLYRGGKLEGTLTFSVSNVIGLDVNDFEVIDSSNMVQPWTFATPPTAATVGMGITINATPPMGINGNFRLRLKPLSVRSAGSTTNNSPAIEVISSAVLVDNTRFNAMWISDRSPNNPDDADPDRSIRDQLTLSEDPGALFNVATDFKVEKSTGNPPPNDWGPLVSPDDDWTIGELETVSDDPKVKFIQATPGSAVRDGTYRLTLREDAFGTDRPDDDIGTGAFAIKAAAAGDPGGPIIVEPHPREGFREAILEYIKKLICDNLVLQEDPEIRFQNDVEGYENLYRLKFLGEDKKIILDFPSRIITTPTDTDKQNVFYAPRHPFKDGFNTSLRALYNRPLQNSDVTGLISGSESPFTIRTPAVFIHIIDGEKDIYWPQRNNAVTSRLGYQVEYLKVAIDCVLRDETEAEPTLNILGNGSYWKDQTQKCIELPDLPQVILADGTSYQPTYHRTINDQAVGFVEDLELLLDPQEIRSRPIPGMPSQSEAQTFNFGPNGQYHADVRNTNLAIWGMLPDSQNSPTDTVRCIFELEIHYPKTHNSS